jgi:hypothetical protein
VSAARILVTVAGVAAIAWVLWYFLALPGPPPAGRSGPSVP